MGRVREGDVGGYGRKVRRVECVWTYLLGWCCHYVYSCFILFSARRAWRVVEMIMV